MRQNDRKSDCVLLFSGGRDSTLAAVRLGNEYERLVLVTTTTGHMVGIDRVVGRLSELRRHLSRETVWLQVAVAPEFAQRFVAGHQTCLSCHHSYVAAAVRIAADYGAHIIATGYTGYQAGWIEQSPYAISELEQALQAANMKLVLPVADIKTKEEAKKELRRLGLTDVALEQKCLRQDIDPEDALSDRSKEEIRSWRAVLEPAIKSPMTIPVQILMMKRLAAVSEAAR